MLNQIQERLNARISNSHHQLGINIDISISYCKILVCRMDSVVSDINQGSTASIKIKLWLKIKKLVTLIIGTT